MPQHSYQPSYRAEPTDPSSDTENVSTGSDGSNNNGLPSLTFDSNSKCVRLTALPSWNYGSRLINTAYWYETPTDNTLKDFLPTGNKIESDTVATVNDGTGNIHGGPTPVQPVNDNDSDVTVMPEVIVRATPIDWYRVFGSGDPSTPNQTNLCYEDSQSMNADNHSSNIFVPNDLNCIWREIPLHRYVGDINVLENINLAKSFTLIGINKLAMFAGTNPATNPDGSANWKSASDNVGNEYGLTTRENLPQNGAFIIAFDIPKTWNYSSGLPNKEKGYFRWYWSKYAFQLVDCVASFCPDTATDTVDKWEWKPIPEFHFTGFNLLLFEVVGHAIVITNITKVGHHDKRDKHPSFAYIDPDADSTLSGITVEETAMTVGIRAVDIRFAYIPVVYPPAGTLSVAKIQTGYSIAGLVPSAITDTTEITGGKIKIKPTTATEEEAGTGTFGFTMTMSRADVPDVSPALYMFELTAPALTTQVSVSGFPTVNRLRRVTAGLGLENSTGSITLDNRDAALSSVGGVIPCSISGGWASKNSNNLPVQFFKGFVNTSQCVKTSNQSTATFNLVGYDQILKDAIAVNLPIYDGYDDGDAIKDLLARGGWGGYDMYVTGGKLLSVPDMNTPPLFKFAMGRSIMDCIRDIATHSGNWAFVDNFGAFNYIPMSASYGNVYPTTFQEVPTAPGSYDEWLSLTGVKVFNELNNAVIVVGLDSDLSPIVSIQTDPGGAIGNMISDTYLGWLKWCIYQDAKINTAEAAAGIAQRLFQNNNRGRISVTGRVWGNAAIVPWLKIGINLRTDNIGIPSGSLWRVLSATHNLNADDGSYFVDVETEYVDPRYDYTCWWEQ